MHFSNMLSSYKFSCCQRRRIGEWSGRESRKNTRLGFLIQYFSFRLYQRREGENYSIIQKCHFWKLKSKVRYCCGKKRWLCFCVRYMKNVNYPIQFRHKSRTTNWLCVVYSLDKIDKNQQILSTFGVGLKHQQPINSTVWFDG